MFRFFLKLYDRIVLGKPGWTVLVLLCISGCLAYRGKDFRLDASADSLILEHDLDLNYFRAVNERYGTNEFLLVTYTPASADLFEDETLTHLARLRDELRQLPRVSSVLTILDVPLLKNPPVPVKELRSNIKTLESPAVDKALARKEFAESKMYQGLLVSVDMRSTAIVVNLAPDEEFRELAKRRNDLRARRHDGTIAAHERSDLKHVSAAYKRQQDRLNKQRHEDIRVVRDIMDKYRASADLFLGGVPMIAVDMISFIRKDLKFFGCGMIVFLVVTLGMIFRRKRWVMLPMVCCALSAVVMIGLLGVAGWQVTVISSNFISLQLIMTMSLAIHLIVRYTELLTETPDADNRQLVLETVNTIFKPCLYTTLTTIAGFSSLVFCNILPVINFGWMMSVGLVVSLVVTFMLFPAVLMLFPRVVPTAGSKRFGASLTAFFARFTGGHGTVILVASLALIGATAAGISQLEVENSFIDYFRESTEIYQGMKFIDERLGGTTPLDVVIDLEPNTRDAPSPAPDPDDDEEGVFEDFGEFDEAEHDQKYWFTPEKMRLVGEVHDYLDSLPETGKVLSLSVPIAIASDLFGGKPLDSFGLALFFNQLPEEFRSIVLDPYASVEHNQLRLNLRVKDSLKSLRRDALLKRIRADLVSKVGLKDGQFRLAGVMVLYNNMLQSLFRSQIQTIELTVLALMIMFLILFRSIQVSLIAIFPNLMSALVVLGVMGLLGIPLDMMTITIVAISVGIAVDDTIHYIHRFRHEFEHDRNYMRTMFRCHGSIGNAMYYTSITITIGFSILAISNFIPTVLFGLLTGLAMAIALVAALTLLPRLIILFKPFGPETVAGENGAGSSGQDSWR